MTANAEIRFEFTGKGSDILSAEGVKTFLKYVCIVGIPWGWIATARWMLRNVRGSMGTTMSFAGTATQAGGFAVVFIVVSLLRRWNFSDAAIFQGAPRLLFIVACAWMFVLWAMTAYVQLAFLRWEIEKSELSSGVAPKFTGGFWANFGWNILAVASIFTVVGWAWVSAAYFRWVCRHTTAGDYRGGFTGRGSEILWRGVLAFLGCIPIITIPWMFCWWFRWFFGRVSGQLDTATIDGTAVERRKSLLIAAGIMGLAVAAAGGAFVPGIVRLVTSSTRPQMAQRDTEANMVTTLREAAGQGDADAQVTLGKAYYLGQGVPQDYAQAVLWYRKAAEQGNAFAQSVLAFSYAMGQGVPQDDAQAVLWYRKAAEQGDANAQYELGQAYSWGDRGVPQDYTQAVLWLRKAADQGNADGMLGLSVSYSSGEGVAQDYVEAHKWLNLSAALASSTGGQKFNAAARDSLAQKKMTRQEIAEAQKRASEWLAAFESRKK
jgi:TPR repeat protein